MNTHRILMTIILLIAVSFSATPIVNAQDEAGVSKEFERLEWVGKVSEGDRVVIDNPYGDVRLRFGGYHGVIESVAVIQLLRTDGAYLEVEPVISTGTTKIRTKWSMKPGLDLPIPLEGDRSRVDLAVLIPTGVTVEVKTDAGFVEAHGVRCDTEIHTESGRVLIRKHQGAVSAWSNSGNIEATLLLNTTDKAQTYSSRTGAIEVWLAAAAKNNAVVTTSGAITTDFSIDIEHLTGQEPDKKGTATIGEGGPDILLKSLRGNLALRRLVETHSSAADH